MKHQYTDHNCGPTSIQNALLVLGFGSNQKTLAKLCGTHKVNGTDENGMIACLDFLGMATECFSDSSTQAAITWLRNSVCKYPVIACIDSWDHWVVVSGDCGGRICLQDSDFSDATNRRQHGTRWLTYSGFLRKWRASRTISKTDRYYGIAVKGRR